MARRGVDLPGVGRLDDFAQVHHRDAVGDVLDHGEVVGDEDERQVHFALQVEQQVDDLGLDGDVQGGHRLVADNELGLECDGPGDADALALAAGEFVGEAIRGGGVQAYPFE